MTKFFEINAYAKNSIYHRSANFVLDGDNKFRDSSRSGGRVYGGEADAIDCFDLYATQSAAAEFTAYTDVEFELVMFEIAEEDGDCIQHVLKKATFEVEGDL